MNLKNPDDESEKRSFEQCLTWHMWLVAAQGKRVLRIQ